ncbi:MAG: class I SAM-dependent methyltransferase [Candidatus Taylorbacteria bacterium]|nr:class I SAM-dependent methyltransferase [Candidatus Taylorbacteria bacterium]
MRCKICDSDSKLLFNALVLRKHDVGYYICPKCGFIQTEKPYWLHEAYKNAINACDTGLLARNQRFSKPVALIIYYFLGKDIACLDYAGGYGVFTRLMRDIGFDFYWHDPYCENLFAKGFELDKAKRRIGLVTAFEAFEHFEDPKAELEKILSISRTVLFSTDLVPQPAPKLNEWWYYSPEHGQHVSFYSKKSIETLAKTYNLRYYTDNKRLHLLTDRKLPLFSFRLVTHLRKLGMPYHYVKSRVESRIKSDMRTVI